MLALRAWCQMSRKQKVLALLALMVAGCHLHAITGIRTSSRARFSTKIKFSGLNKRRRRVCTHRGIRAPRRVLPGTRQPRRSDNQYDMTGGVSSSYMVDHNRVRNQYISRAEMDLIIGKPMMHKRPHGIEGHSPPHSSYKRVKRSSRWLGMGLVMSTLAAYTCC